jgi:hypothetical protein
MAATTAVVAGTAGAVAHHQQQKYANQAAEQQAQQQAEYDAGAAAAQEAAPSPAPAGGTDLVAELQKLGSLKEAGILTDEEFSAAKAKLLA